jgi:hypothetical protein
MVAYALASLFNSAFVNEASVLHMVSETDRVFANKTTVAPTFYINSRKLQEVTEQIMFPANDEKTKVLRKRQGPLYTAEKRFLDCFQQAELAQQKNGVDVRRHILQWGDFLEKDSYPPILAFVEAILLPEKESVLSRDDAINSVNIEDEINDVITLFSKHNMKKFRKETDVNGFCVSPEENETLRRYLVQEFSVLIMLASFDTLQLIKNAYVDARVNIAVSISEKSPIQPVLAYPISASSDQLAERTFSLFLSIQKEYVANCTRLNLPTVTRPLVIVDSLVPSKISAKKGKILAAAPTIFVSNSRNDALSLDGSRSTQENNLKVHPITTTDVAMFVAPGGREGISYDTSVANITEAILELIKEHRSTKEKSAEIGYKNGITCTIKILSENSPKETVIDLEQQEKALYNRIYKSAYRASKSQMTDKREFEYAGCLFSYETKPSHSVQAPPPLGTMYYQTI